MKTRWWIFGILAFATGATLWTLAADTRKTAQPVAITQTGKENPNMYKCDSQLTDEELKKRLTPEQYRVVREKGTERAFSGAYWKTKTPGTYKCVVCGAPLFESDTKFESGTGWPSFWRPETQDSVTAKEDRSFGMVRTEVVCSKCGAHLGHVFDDGPEPTGLRYCINSAALSLEPNDGKTTGTAVENPEAKK